LLEKAQIEMKQREFSPVCKLKQVLISVLAGCETLTVFNTEMQGEDRLAAICGGSGLQSNRPCRAPWTR